MIYEGLTRTELAANRSHGQYRQTAMRYDAVAHDIKATDAFMAQHDLLTSASTQPCQRQFSESPSKASHRRSPNYDDT